MVLMNFHLIVSNFFLIKEKYKILHGYIIPTAHLEYKLVGLGLLTG